MKLKIKLDNTYLDELGFNISPNYSIGAPQAKTHVIEVPFSNGSIDLTEAITGGVTYHNRVIAFELQKLRPKNTWQALYHSLLNQFHGKRVKAHMPYDDEHHFLGRCEMSALDRGDYMQVSVTVDAEPYRLKNSLTSITFQATPAQQIVILQNESMPSTPTITVSGDTFVKFGTRQWSINEGTHKLALTLKKGDNEITIQSLESTDVSVNFEYQEGAL